jgi:hypothetical protein
MKQEIKVQKATDGGYHISFYQSTVEKIKSLFQKDVEITVNAEQAKILSKALYNPPKKKFHRAPKKTVPSTQE